MMQEPFARSPLARRAADRRVGASAGVAGSAQAPRSSAGARPAAAFPGAAAAAGRPELVERGKQVYGISCRSCHGADLRGGDMGGPNLLRSRSSC